MGKDLTRTLFKKSDSRTVLFALTDAVTVRLADLEPVTVTLIGPNVCPVVPMGNRPNGWLKLKF
jgi:hypothetical protein